MGYRRLPPTYAELRAQELEDRRRQERSRHPRRGRAILRAVDGWRSEIDPRR